MINIPLGAGHCAVAVGWALFRWRCCRKIGFSWKRECLQLLFLINLAVLYRFTFHPFGKVEGKVQPLLFEWAAVWPFRVNLVPLVNILQYDSRRDLLLNLIGNSTMFIPTGILLPSLYQNMRSFKKTVLNGCALSLAIELLQLPFAVRASDVDDVILNTAGCILGYGLWYLVRKRK